MKRILSCLLALMLVFGCVFALSACGDDEKDDKDDKSEAVSSDAGSTGDDESVADASSADESSADTSSADTSSDYVVPAGYTLYETDDISFAYPSAWELADGDAPQMVDNATGNNVNMVTEVLTAEIRALYEGMSVEIFDETFKPVYEALGMTVGAASVGTIENSGGLAFSTLSFSITTEGIGMDMTQLFVLDDTNCYVITFTMVTPVDGLVDTITDSIRLK